MDGLAPGAKGDEPSPPDDQRGQIVRCEPARVRTHQTPRRGQGDPRRAPGRASASRAHLVAGFGGAFAAGLADLADLAGEACP